MATSSSAAVTGGVKRAREERPEELTDQPPSKKAKLESFIPQLQQSSDRKRKVTIHVQTDQGFLDFKIRKSMLRALSPHFDRLFSSEFQESHSETMVWKGSGANPNIHPQAAAQIIQFARRGSDFLASECRSLAQLKQAFPDEFHAIFHDIVRLCAYFQIDALKQECLTFFMEELKSDVEGKMAEYFPMTLNNSEFAAFYSDALCSLSSEESDRLKIFPALVSLYQADYPDFSKEQIASFQTYLRDCFEKILESDFSPKTIEMKLFKHDIALCTTFKELYPRFDFSMKILPLMQSRISITVSPSVPFVRQIMGFIYAALGRPFHFQASRFPIILPQAPGDAQEYSELTEVLKAPSQLQLQRFNHFILAYPENVFAIATRGVCHADKGDLDAAIADFNRALELQPNYPTALARRGDCHRQKGNLDAAMADLNRAIELQPDHRFALGRRGDCHRQKGNLDAAFADLNRAIDLKPDSPFALAFRGECHRQKGDLDVAMADFNRALKLFDGLLEKQLHHPEITRTRERCLEMLGKDPLRTSLCH